ncbi:uncharacterized protein [Bemisia tabaci]|uniref:uncharacterized protein isoform X1 n=2 Tax=Bemisia tabaci TaxID=7038 RepID=UPI003B28C44C
MIGSFAPTNLPDPEPLTRTPNYPAALERRYHMPAQTPYEYPSRLNTPNSPHWLDAFISNLNRDNFGGGIQMSPPRLMEDIHYVDPHTGSSYQRQSWVQTSSSNQPNGWERRGRAVHNPVQGGNSMTLERRPSFNGRSRRHPRPPFLPFNPLPPPPGKYIHVPKLNELNGAT